MYTGQHVYVIHPVTNERVVGEVVSFSGGVVQIRLPDGTIKSEAQSAVQPA